MSYERPTIAQVTAKQNEVAAWNEKHPIGTPVEVQLDGGNLFETKTRSPAWLLGSHTACVMIEGIAGCYALNRVRALSIVVIAAMILSSCSTPPADNSGLSLPPMRYSEMPTNQVTK